MTLAKQEALWMEYEWVDQRLRAYIRPEIEDRGSFHYSNVHLVRQKVSDRCG